MDFSTFAQKLKPIIGGSQSTDIFVINLFEEIVADEELFIIEEINKNTSKAYYNGKTGITKISQHISPFMEPEKFVSYLNTFPDAITQRLCETFKNDITDINMQNADEKIAYLFESILIDSAKTIRKSTPKRADNNISNDLIDVPEENIVDKNPYSLEDNQLLQEFVLDYDAIMKTMIGDNYYISLIEGTLQNEISRLYETKWRLKANNFVDPSLKSYIFAVLGELNNINNCFTSSKKNAGSIKKIRTKIRNSYVYLHPESYSVSFPYDVFIDDWDESEY